MDQRRTDKRADYDTRVYSRLYVDGAAVLDDVGSPHARKHFATRSLDNRHVCAKSNGRKLTPPTLLGVDKKRQLYYGDNLEILRTCIPDNSVDLCYIDPPFNSKRNYFQIYNNIGGEDKAQAAAFVDTWEWGEEANNGYDYITDIRNLQNGVFTEQTVELIRGLRKVLGAGALLAYLVHMALRIREIHRVLKPTGSFYLHCDPTASHYLKLILDSVFCTCGGDFINEIIWSYKSGGASKLHFARKHDVILFYAKSVKSKTFNVLKEKSCNRELKPYRFKGVEEFNDNIGWYTMINMTDVWRINMVGRTSQERLGYPTQKPRGGRRAKINALTLRLFFGWSATAQDSAHVARWLRRRQAFFLRRRPPTLGGPARYFERRRGVGGCLSIDRRPAV